MAAPVWQLSINLETKTAAFTSGLADAAKGARGSFQDIKEGAREMGASTRTSMTEARHSVMLLGEEFGVHLPRALTSFIASIGPVGAAMEAAFPFLAIVVGATLLLEHLSKLKAEGDKLTESQMNFGTTVSNVLNGLDDKLLQAGIRTDELNHDHMAALNKELELIDHQTFNELARSFETIAKSADATFADLKASFTESFFQISKGSEGAKHALSQFKAQYDSLLSQHKDKEASDLLAGTLESAKKSYELMQAQQGGHGSDEKELAAESQLVEVLQAQIEAKERIRQLKDLDGSHARRATDDKIGGDSDKAAREQAGSQRKEMEEAQKLWEQNYREAVSALQESEQEKIDATDKGSQERLAAIDAAIKEENAKGLQQTGFYKSLCKSRIQTTREMDDEQKKIDAEAGKEEAEHSMKMGELKIAADRTQSQLSLSAMRNNEQARIADAKKFADAEYQTKLHALQQESIAVEKSGKDVANKKKALDDKERELTQAHANQITQIETQAQEQRNSRMMAAQNRMDDALASGISKTLMRHQSFAAMMGSLGDQIISGMIQNAIKSILMNDMTKESDAAAAARKAFLAGMHFPFPANIVMGPALGAMAFASVMAFEKGGIVPGVGRGDIVPAMLEPGEGVLTKKVMEGLSNRAKFGSDNGGGDTHVHHSHNHFHISAIDGASVKGMLDRHGDQFVKHAEGHLRKMNR